MPRIRTGQKLTTRRGLSLKLRQSIQILALNQLELESLIREELKENPFLEEKEEIYSDNLPSSDYHSEYLPPTPGQDSDFSIENQLSSKSSLGEVLQRQLSVLSINPKILSLVENILSSLDEQGFSKDSHEKVATDGGFSLRELRSAVKILEDLEPTGVGAEDIWQSLEWQAQKKYPNDLNLRDLIALLQNSYGSLEGINEQVIDEIAQGLAVSIEEVKEDFKKLVSLNLYPAANYNDKSIVILPDILFIDRGKSIEIQVNNKYIPEIMINDDLFKQIPEKDRSDDWKNMFENAQNIMKSLDYRNNSLLKVGAAILQKQTEFFKKGPDYIVPMSLEDIASMVDLHVSTVSRIVKKKYCQTKFGVFQLKIFFLRKLKSYDGKLLGVEDLKKAIQRVIESENPAFPLSDQKISSILESEGFNVKRRTVAKYRKLLHIPSQNLRKANSSKELICD